MQALEYGRVGSCAAHPSPSRASKSCRAFPNGPEPGSVRERGSQRRFPAVDGFGPIHRTTDHYIRRRIHAGSRVFPSYDGSATTHRFLNDQRQPLADTRQHQQVRRLIERHERRASSIAEYTHVGQTPLLGIERAPASENPRHVTQTPGKCLEYIEVPSSPRTVPRIGILAPHGRGRVRREPAPAPLRPRRRTYQCPHR